MSPMPNSQPLMSPKVKLHDGIIGALILVSTLLAWAHDPRWLALTALTAGIMISSAFTGFCPVHWAISKVLRS